MGSTYSTVSLTPAPLCLVNINHFGAWLLPSSLLILQNVEEATKTFLTFLSVHNLETLKSGKTERARLEFMSEEAIRRSLQSFTLISGLLPLLLWWQDVRRLRALPVCSAESWHKD